MKKLTAGIFSGLLTICMVGAANADIASTGYVNAKTDALSDLIESRATTDAVNNLAGRIDTNAQDINALQGTIGTDELETTSQNLVGAINELKGDMSNVASDATVSALGGRVDTLDTNVSDLSTNVSDLNAAITDTDTGLAATNQIASDAATAAANAAAAVNATNAVIETYGDIVTHNTDEFATAAQGALAATAVQPAAIADFVTATDIDEAISGKQAALTDTQIAAVDSGITAARVEQYNAYADEIAQKADTSTVNTELAKKANTTDLGALAMAKLPDSCGRAGATCVLTFNGTTYAWEDISRSATGE